MVAEVRIVAGDKRGVIVITITITIIINIVIAGVSDQRVPLTTKAVVVVATTLWMAVVKMPSVMMAVIRSPPASRGVIVLPTDSSVP